MLQSLAQMMQQVLINELHMPQAAVASFEYMFNADQSHLSVCSLAEPDFFLPPVLHSS